jgi:FAD synthetase
VPKSTKLLGLNETAPNGTQLSFPSFQIHNVVAFPGVPTFCEQSFRRVEESLFSSDTKPFFTRCLYLAKNEAHLQVELNRIVERHPRVCIGSYPAVGHSYYKTKITVESEGDDEGLKAYEEMRQAFEEFVTDYDEQPWIGSSAKLEKFVSTQPEEFQRVLNDSVKTIDDILEEYNLEQISLSFNGGKDCTLLLHLLRCRVDK